MPKRERFLGYAYEPVLDPKTKALCLLIAAVAGRCRH